MMWIPVVSVRHNVVIMHAILPITIISISESHTCNYIGMS